MAGFYRNQAYIEKVIRHSLTCYDYIEKTSSTLEKIIMQKIQPFLDEGNFDLAKKMVIDFYEPARYKTKENPVGEIIFIEHDLILALINQLKNASVVETVDTKDLKSFSQK